ncbi:phosphoglycerol transferase MdoB-like AlkP superfamily enzyme [Chitinophaga skermanii]|uniref:Phosphoglycerol transferase MdoB-like AlkP superfamily enzyme n=1 Tax=Chitinophaga skermanii TaxID=331697 RepID=A0A327QD90_9BACT|nr:LTA synthase family protein [Chitinophaga skermanii]RAJ02626.1 phosphoglycerol transferase MdoB-like AlkP superfamily enzyme [Chitinophaga skermanii]
MKSFWTRIPKYTRYILLQAVCLFAFLVLFRVIFYFFFFKTTVTDPSAVSKAWHLGLKFDMRLALISLAPLAILITIARNRFFSSKAWKTVNYVYLFLLYFLLTWFYVIDLGHYSYLGIRIDPSITRFLASGERMTNAKMVWQSYPVIKGLLAIAVFLGLIYFGLSKLYKSYARKPESHIKAWPFTFWVIGLVFLFAAGIYANLAYFPLRWSQAMFTRDNGITSLSLNPVLYFVNNFSVNDDTYDKEATQKYYPYIADYLKVDKKDVQNLDFVRTVPANPEKPRQNVIIVMCESLGASMTSMFDNPMNATPNMQQLANQGVLFKNFYVPAMSTARTVFGVTTGLPDITINKTASRHPNIVDQRVIMDQFDGYDKYYLLGGNTNWANIRAVFSNNIDGIKIFEEGYYKAGKADVWGVSDYDLITEASAIFKASNDQKKPFIAFLQTADNHEPYTTTPGAGDFKPLTEKEIDMNAFKKAGFLSIGQFNALRYLDYNIKHLMDMAKKDGYLENTIFVFFGDHSARLNPYKFMPVPEYEIGMFETHVPCIIYNPKTLQPQVVTRAGSLLDVYPTVAGMVGMPYKNYTLGVDLLDSTRTSHYAFTIYPQDRMALVGEQYLFEINKATNKTALFDLKGDPLKNVAAEYPDTAKYLDNLTRAFYESTRYLMFNNKKH